MGMIFFFFLSVFLSCVMKWFLVFKDVLVCLRFLWVWVNSKVRLFFFVWWIVIWWLRVMLFFNKVVVIDFFCRNVFFWCVIVEVLVVYCVMFVFDFLLGIIDLICFLFIGGNRDLVCLDVFVSWFCNDGVWLKLWMDEVVFVMDWLRIDGL